MRLGHSIKLNNRFAALARVTLSATFAVGVLWMQPVQADPLKAQIEHFLLQNYPQKPDSIRIDYTRQAPTLSCQQPQLALMSPNRMWGRITLKAVCDARRHFIPVTVEVTGKYVATAQPIQAGQTITLQDVKLASGRLDKLSPRILFDLDAVVGRIALRHFSANQPITDNMLRKDWLVKAGQTVQVQASGEGFMIKSQGKAMTNGALNQVIKVKTVNGAIVSARVNQDRSVSLVL